MAFQKGHPGYRKGIPNRSTLLKEERRAIFEQKATEMWEDIISKLPPTYVADQFMGKAPDKIDLKVEETEPSIKIKEIAVKLNEVHRQGDSGSK